MLFVNLPVYLTVLIISCSIAGYLVWSFYNKKLKKNVTRIRPATTTDGIRRRALTTPAHRRAAARARAVDDTATAVEEPSTTERSNLAVDNSSGDEDANAEQTGKKKIGTKKAAKLAEKERRKEEREADERYREHQRKIEDQEIAKRKKEEEKEEKAATATAALDAKQLEEEAAREQAEYERLKVEFSVEDEGTDLVQMDNAAESQIINQLIDAVKEGKIIPIEHLALDMNLKTEACVNRLKQLLTSGQLTGLFDDRGKFVYITPEEYEAVAKFIEKRGRVTLADLASNGHSLLDFNKV